MKKSFISLSLLVFGVTFVSIFFWYCQKPEIQLSTEKAVQILTNEEIDAKLEKIRNKIASFKSGNAGNRDEDNVVPQDAALDVETLINATYGDSGYLFGESTVSKITLQIPLNNEGKVATSDFVTAYDGAVCHLGGHYENSNSNFRHVFLIDTRIDSVVNSIAYMIITSIIGTKPAPEYESAPSCSEVYETSDEWEHGFGHGKCGGYSDPQYIGQDGATRTTDMLNTHVFSPLPGGLKYFINVEHSQYNPFSGIEIEGVPTYGPEVFDYVADPVEEDNIRDYLVFVNKSGLPNYPETCITKDNMEWYTCNWATLFDTYKPAGKTFAYCDIRGTGITASSGAHWLHNCDGFSGYPISVDYNHPYAEIPLDCE